MEWSVSTVLLAIEKWDWMSIFYSFFASIIFAILLKWGGVLNILNRKFKLYRGIKKYRNKLKDECSSLIVIGRRSGFAIADVYVDLDISRSDLNQADSGARSRPNRSYVLVGGPGAGKSTTVKNIVLRKLSLDGTLPFLVRLREYHGYQSIEECLVEKLKEAGVPDPEVFLRSELQKNVTCILDGLDEVRPHLRDEIYTHINQFYNKYFVSGDSFSNLIVSCRKEAYRNIPLDLPEIWEVRPLTDEQIKRFAEKWPLDYPKEKSKDTFWRDLGAANKILELARSPLLLIGGLMQYTESNQGIPEERFEYLRRVANWLVADWAAAQGHPPDPNRPVYDRILPKIAFHMQDNEVSELRISDCVALLENWLPTFGYNADDALSLIDSIATKTGILVREGGSNVVFAQFSLQEYFASLDVIGSVGALGVSKLNPVSWWRETILLTVAQQRDPNELLEALFLSSPLLAVSAVSECPTPSIAMQDRAIEVCLSAIDAVEKAAGGAAVTLLRKVKAGQEKLLLTELEKRLEHKCVNDDILSLVGLSLATAGTPQATAVLAKHPEVWDACLKEVGYLSTSFENLLVEWIERGNFEQSTRAIDMIASRLSVDRTNQLLELLPSLQRDQSEYLASSILNKVLDDESLLFGRGRAGGIYSVISGCAPYIRNDSLLDRDDATADTLTRYSYMHGFRTLAKRVLMVSKKDGGKSSSQLLELICNAERWSSGWTRTSAFVTACLSVLLYFSGNLGFTYAGFLQGVVMFIFLVVLSIPASAPPWLRQFNFRAAAAPPLFLNISVFLLGGLSLYAIGYRQAQGEFQVSSILYFIPALMIMSSYMMGDKHRMFLIQQSESRHHKVLSWSGVIYVLCILIFAIANKFIPDNNLLTLLLVSISGGYLVFLIFSSLRLFIDWRVLKVESN